MPSMKRPAAAAAKPPAKVAKAAASKATASPKKAAPPPLLSKCDVVVSAILECDGLPVDCRDMLAAAFPGCLVTTRHAIQDSMIAMVEEVLQAQESTAANNVEAAQLAAAAAETRKGEQEQVFSAAKEAVAVAQQTSTMRLAEVSQATEALEAAKAAASKAKLTKSSHAQKFQGLSAQKDVLKEQMEAKFISLKEGAATGEVEAEIAFLVAEGSKLGFDNGMMASLPSALSKPPESRGQFDEMVIEQMSTAIKQKQASIDTDLKEGDSEAERLGAAVTQAEQAQAKAAEEQQARVAALEAAKEDVKKAAETLNAANKASTEVGAEFILAEAEVLAKKKVLEDFQVGPYAAFKELRDGPKAAEQEADHKADESAIDATRGEEGAAFEAGISETAEAVST